MSLLMSDSLKGKIDLDSLENDRGELKIESLFYCLYTFHLGDSIFFPLVKLDCSDNKKVKICVSSSNVEASLIKKLFDTKNILKIELYTSDLCIKDVNVSDSNYKIHTIERENLSGYNYRISIVINET